MVGTLFDTKGNVFLTRHSPDVDVKELRAHHVVLPDTGYTWDALISDLENMAPVLIDRDRIRAERKALRERIAQSLAGSPGEASDKAALSNDVGGIDLNRANMQMNINKEGAGVQMQFDRAMVERIKREGFDGLEFKIESIVPIANLPQLLGLSVKE